MKTKYFRLMTAFAVGACTWSAHAQVINEDLELLPGDGELFGLFGHSIAIDNGMVAVGARRERSQSGSAYLFDAVTGAQLFKLLPSDGEANDFFGSSIATDKGVVAVGATGDGDNGANSGSAYLFDATTGAQLFKLLPSDGAGSEFFGQSIAIDYGVVAVGAYFDEDNGPDSGSAYLFDAATGVQLFKLLPSDGATNDWFGSSIAIGNGMLAVGAPGDDDNGAQSGSVYLFDATGAQLAKLWPSDAAAGDRFGSSIAIDNGMVAVGANKDFDNGTNPGSVYLFDAITGAQLAQLLPNDGAVGDLFGGSIAIHNDVVAVGAMGDGDNGMSSGSAYLFSVPAPPCPADLTGDGELNFFDVSAFLTAFASQDPAADFTGDGSFNFFDVSAFLTAFSEGCP